jgi:hypothetical protein
MKNNKGSRVFDSQITFSDIELVIRHFISKLQFSDT